MVVENTPFYCLLVGPSGCGISTALDAFSDYGFVLAGDIPPDRFVDTFHSLSQVHPRVVFTINLTPESQGHLAVLIESIKAIQQQTPTFKILILDAPDHILVQRYMNSGKRHVFDAEGLQQGVTLEKSLYSPFKTIKDYSIDTNATTPKELHGKIAKILGYPSASDEFTVNINSFGFKYGVPQDAELVFDMRFIKNPFYEDALREQTGLDPDVKEYIFAMPHVQEFFQQWSALVAMLLPHYQSEGKARLSVAIGCTGGKHRSVCMAEALGEALKTKFPAYNIGISHREVLRWPSQTLAKQPSGNKT